MTKNLSFKILIVFVFLFIFFLFSGLPVKVRAVACSDNALCGAKPGCCFGSVGCANYWQCKCQDNDDCNGVVERRHCTGTRSRYCTCDCTSDCGQPTETCAWSCKLGGCNISCPAQPSLSCETYEKCTGSEGWTNDDSSCSNITGTCECKGGCLADPTNTHLEDGVGPILSTNAPLPIKLAWDNVDGANSYWYRVWKATSTNIGWGTSEATTTGTTTATSIVPGTSSCTFLQSTSTYSWKVKPCCSADGTNGTECKDWNDVSTSTFETSLAPEPASPVDPDWNLTTQMALAIPIPVILDWCNVEKADYYRLKLYTIVGGVENCHRLLESGGNCLSMKVDKNTTWPYNELTSAFEDTGGTWFLRNTEYRWEAATCFMEEGVEICSDFGQKWGLDTTSTLDISSFEQISPLDGSTVGLPMVIKWNGAVGVNSTNYEVLGPGGPFTGTVIGLTVESFDYPDLALDKSYNWRIKPCFDANGMDCGNWTPFWTFKTTGAKPIVSSPPSPSNGANNVVIPVSFDWSDIPGAGSYKFQLADNAAFNPTTTEEVLLSSSFLLDYPDLEMDINYRWRVQTCARQDGTACGNWSNVWSFKTFIIGSPVPPITPSDGTFIDEPGMINFSWSSVSGAKAYHFVVSFFTGEEIFNELVSSNSISKNPILFPETGIYNWQVRACLDENCIATGNWSNVWSFDLALIAPPGMRGGLVPCGRQYDDPDTPWNERESCQISHIFLLLRNVLDFLLWKVATILLVLILLAAGALFYISMGDSRIIFKVKSALKTMVIGYIIIFFAWFFVNLFLALIGYNFQFFGRWWEIPL